MMIGELEVKYARVAHQPRDDVETESRMPFVNRISGKCNVPKDRHRLAKQVGGASCYVAVAEARALYVRTSQVYDMCHASGFAPGIVWLRIERAHREFRAVIH